MKEALRSVGCLTAEEITWKSWRAGKATEMAKEGFNLGQILIAGEWASRSFLRYVDLEKINQANYLGVTIDYDDEKERLDGMLEQP